MAWENLRDLPIDSAANVPKDARVRLILHQALNRRHMPLHVAELPRDTSSKANGSGTTRSMAGHCNWMVGLVVPPVGARAQTSIDPSRAYGRDSMCGGQPGWEHPRVRLR